MELTYPLISICIPNYNNKAYIADAIKSAVNQSYSNIEVVVVDNCSTDGSWEIIEQLALQNNRVKAFRNTENLGMVNNFRKTLENANGEYITFLCSDDILYPDAIITVVKKYLEEPHLNFIFGNINYSGQRIGKTNHHFEGKLKNGQWTTISLELAENMTFLTGTIFKKINEAPSVTIQDLTFFDWYLWLRLGLKDVGFVAETLGEHRYHKFNQTNILTPGLRKNTEGLLAVINLLEKNNILKSDQADTGRLKLIEKLAKTKITQLKWAKIFSGSNDVITLYEEYRPLTFQKKINLMVWCVYGKLQIAYKYGFKA